jgi:hypothetical protein
MLDMFTILIIFLLKSYSAEGIILTIPADLYLPNSTTQSAPAPGLVIELSKESLVVDGTILPVNLDEVERSDSLLIPELLENLKARVRWYEQISAVNPEVNFTEDPLHQRSGRIYQPITGRVSERIAKCRGQGSEVRCQGIQQDQERFREKAQARDIPVPGRSSAFQGYSKRPFSLCRCGLEM